MKRKHIVSFTTETSWRYSLSWVEGEARALLVLATPEGVEHARMEVAIGLVAPLFEIQL